MLVNVDASHRQRILGQISGIHRDVRVRHGRQHRQTAVAAAQVQHRVRGFAEPVVQGAVHQQLGNQGAWHDGALIHIERHAHQPGFVRQVSGRLAGFDSCFQKCSYLRLFHGGYRPIGYKFWLAPSAIKWCVERQAELPQHQPGGLVKSVVGAVAKGHTRLGELGGGRFNQFQHRHAASPALRVSSTRR